MAKRGTPSAFDKDLYAILRVSPRAEPEIIDAAHRALLKLYAPRALSDSDKRATEIGEAFVILSDPVQRRDYDDYRKQELKTIGPYKLLNRVAEGGFGVTYKAQHIGLGGLACIKHCSEISPVAEDILRQEANIIWGLSHPSIPSMKDFITLDDGSVALAMSWAEGLTIEEVVKKHGKIDPENVSWIIERILNSLVFLHHHGILHGDLKPQNIIVDDTTHNVVLVDFGLSLSKPTATTKSKGYTELFAPEEQKAGKTLVPGSDFYSLGMTALYALSGSFQAAARKEVPQDVPDEMCTFLRKLLPRNVLDRPRSASALFEEFLSVRKASFGRMRSGMKKFA